VTDQTAATEDIERHDFDVVVIGAGGAGLRAAIAAREEGLRTAIICKSLFGKAHTVMAEGGSRRADGQRQLERQLAGPLPRHDARWQVPRTTGGWPELHAKEAPERVWELGDRTGALFDRTKDGRISQRNFGGPRVPAPGARR
jgi:succinate dehydrogenase / fumarate reductase flavoprotein subunit